MHSPGGWQHPTYLMRAACRPITSEHWSYHALDQARGRDRRRNDGSHRVRRDPVSSRTDAEGSRKRALGAFPGASHSAGNGCRWRIPAVELLVSHVSCCPLRPSLRPAPLAVVRRHQCRWHPLVPAQCIARRPGPGAAAQRPRARRQSPCAHRGRGPHRCRAGSFAGAGAAAGGTRACRCMPPRRWSA